MKKSILLKAIISELPEDERMNENVKKTCKNCYNRGATLIPLGLYWAESRCRYCENYSDWSHVSVLLKEFEKGTLKDEM